MAIESENAKEEIREIIDNCIRCGICKNLCSVHRIMREETYSPRGKAVMFDDGVIERIVYECNLCKACEEKCPAELKLCSAFIKARQVLVAGKKEIPANKEMIKNLDKTGNIFGIKEEKVE